jgi:hypothetical protein
MPANRMNAAAALVLLAGCASESEKPPPAPLPTDGPNQVVVYIPAMV